MAKRMAKDSVPSDDRLVEKTLREETIFSGRILDVRLRTVRLPGGTEASREIVMHRGAAAIVAVDEQNRVALVRQYRAPLNRVILELPAGKRDSWDEDPLLCARRELKEETGLLAERWRLLTVTQTTPGFTSEEIWIYLATGLTQGEECLDEDEFLSVCWQDISSALDDVRTGEIGDAKTALGLLLAENALQGE